MEHCSEGASGVLAQTPKKIFLEFVQIHNPNPADIGKFTLKQSNIKTWGKRSSRFIEKTYCRRHAADVEGARHYSRHLHAAPVMLEPCRRRG